jgi:hypothetical protein
MSIEILTAQILDKMPRTSKWQRNFFLHLFSIYLRVQGRFNFENISRYGEMNEATYRLWYKKGFDFIAFNTALIKQYLKEEMIIAFDPCYLSKSGKKTAGTGYFWSGVAGAVKYGIEISGFAMVGLTSKTAMHFSAHQTMDRKEGQTLLAYYGELITMQAERLKKLSNILVVDAYFSSKGFVDTVVENDLTMISRLAKNAVLRYLYTGEKTGKRGRPKKYDGVVEKEALDPEHFHCFMEDGDVKAYEGIVNVKSFKREVKCVILHTKTKSGSTKVETFFSTDTTMSGEKILKSYRLRFQIEFLYRDGKQHAGLAHCQAVSKEQIHTHVNVSLTVVSLAKAAYHLSIDETERGAFSLDNIKRLYFNRFFINRFFDEFGESPNLNKKSKVIQTIYNLGRMAA